ncbi:MAG: hypothetical protein JWP10_1472, partial [Nocardioidaceae bacterium]|nr:hypothetical protein [Nocardioidaceae bacterium]
NKNRTSLCSTTPSGEDIRMVTQRKSGGEAVDMTAEYVPGLDSFVAKKSGRKYVVEAYDGTLTISKSGKVESREESVDYQSLDNEPDGD